MKAFEVGALPRDEVSRFVRGLHSDPFRVLCPHCVGKELEIRRALSPSHLYSSAFVVQAEPERLGVPQRFTLIGAGWGHGVGLCQIGAALMAELGYPFRQILEHYYAGSELQALYPSVA